MLDREEYLKKNGITPTPVRIMVLKCFEHSLEPLSLGDIESKLESVDKSTISRCLSLFKERNLLHSFNDGSNSLKYELVQTFGEEDDQHIHFRCEKCGKTVCLQTLKIPHVELPEGFIKHNVNYVISGCCPDCSKDGK